MLHIGERDYYHNVMNILRSSGLLLVEGVRQGQETNDQCDKIRPYDLQIALASKFDLIHQNVGIYIFPVMTVNIDVSTDEILAAEAKLPTFKKMVEKYGLQNSDRCTQSLAASIDIDAEGMTLDLALRLSKKAFNDWKFNKSNIHSREMLANLILEYQMHPHDQEVEINMRDRVALQGIQMYSKYPGMITVVYGAAHMPGIEAGLMKMGYIPEKEEWLTVFNY